MSRPRFLLAWLAVAAAYHGLAILLIYLLGVLDRVI